jgi:hypothetical protein
LAPKLSQFVAGRLSLEEATLALNVGRGPTGFWGGLYTQIFSDFYLFYLILYLTFLKSTSLSHSNTTLDIPFIFMSAKKSVAYEALLDSGATENFIDPQMMEKLGIRKVPIVNPRMVFNVDGTEN